MSVHDDLFQSHARPQHDRFYGETVTLRRGAQTTAGVTAVKASGDAETDGEENFDLRQRMTDWLVDAADYKIGGSAVAPQQGDEILWTTGGETRVYLISDEGTLSPWEYSDAGETRYRLHTVYTGTE